MTSCLVGQPSISPARRRVPVAAGVETTGIVYRMLCCFLLRDVGQYPYIHTHWPWNVDACGQWARQGTDTKRAAVSDSVGLDGWGELGPVSECQASEYAGLVRLM